VEDDRVENKSQDDVMVMVGWGERWMEMKTPWCRTTRTRTSEVVEDDEDDKDGGGG
jgi:hypothetical protein